ncbi:MAG: hypothetical protein SF028_07645 [Candidatus Sumerlaeia bacterium]|nr:hypothetical protein [Candidatus Sumerlaeia bacterium]
MRILLVVCSVVSITTTLSAQQLAEVGNYGENISTVAIDGAKGVLNEGTSLRVIDMTVPTAPSFKGSVSLGSVPTGVFVVGNYAYVAGYTGPFSVISIADSNAPTLAGSVDWEAWKNAVWVRRGGDYAYLGTCGTVEVVDVRTKTAPVRVGSLGQLESCVESITGDGGYLYVVTDGAATRVRIYSLASPASPLLLGTIPGNAVPSRRANSVAVFGDVLYVGQEDGTQAYDITDRAAPRLMGRVETEDRYYETAMDVDRGLLYVADWERADVWQLASPDAPSPFIRIDGGPEHQVRQVAAYSGIALAARTYALSLANPTAGTNTDVRALTPGTGWAGTLAASGTTLYLGTGPGLATLSLANPTQPALLNHQYTRWSGDLKVVGNSLYSLSPWGYLEAYDITTASNPTWIAEYPVSGGLDTLRLSVTATLVAATAGNQMILYTRSSGGTLTERSRTTLPTGANAVALAGSTAYAALTNGTVRVYSVSNPSSPSLITTRTVFGSTGAGIFNVDAEVAGNRLHLLYGRTGYAVIDISTPASPSVLGTFAAFELEGSDIAVEGNTAYLATFGWNGRRGIRALNISNPSSIQEIATVRATGLPRSVLVTSGFLYSAEDKGALRVRNLAPAPAGHGSGFMFH